MLDRDRFMRASEVVSRLVEGEVLIVPVRGKVGDLASIYALSGVGATIWEALVSPRSFQELLELIVSEYEVTPDQARADLEKFLSEMIAAGLCVPASDTK